METTQQAQHGQQDRRRDAVATADQRLVPRRVGVEPLARATRADGLLGRLAATHGQRRGHLGRLRRLLRVAPSSSSSSCAPRARSSARALELLGLHLGALVPGRPRPRPRRRPSRAARWPWLPRPRPDRPDRTARLRASAAAAASTVVCGRAPDVPPSSGAAMPEPQAFWAASVTIGRLSGVARGPGQEHRTRRELRRVAVVGLVDHVAPARSPLGIAAVALVRRSLRADHGPRRAPRTGRPRGRHPATVSNSVTAR